MIVLQSVESQCPDSLLKLTHESLGVASQQPIEAHERRLELHLTDGFNGALKSTISFDNAFLQVLVEVMQFNLVSVLDLILELDANLALDKESKCVEQKGQCQTKRAFVAFEEDQYCRQKTGHSFLIFKIFLKNAKSKISMQNHKV